MKFTLFLEAGDSRNGSIRATIESVMGQGFEAVACPPGISDWYRMPFVRAANGTAYFGMEEIRMFVDQLAAQSRPARQ